MNKNWYVPVKKEPEQVHVIEREMPKAPDLTNFFECIYGKHKAEILHRGSAYCRACYDQRNPYKQLIDS